LNSVVKNKKRSPFRKRAAKGEPKLYEAMFLVDSADATADWEGVDSAIKNMLEKAGAEIVSIRKWDDRRLAYDIKGHSRGTYILCYFRAEGKRVQDIERDVQLSERIMRVLILSTEKQSLEDIEKEPLSQEDSETGIPKDAPAPTEKRRRKADAEQKTEKSDF